MGPRSRPLQGSDNHSCPVSSILKTLPELPTHKYQLPFARPAIVPRQGVDRRSSRWPDFSDSHTAAYYTGRRQSTPVMTSDGPKTTAPTSEACPQSRPEPSEVTLWTSDVPSDEEAQPRRRRRRGSVSKDDIPDDYDDTYGPSGIGALTSRPHFFPPLWLARRTACLRLLRAENVRSIADLGCGSGSLPSMLVQPAWHRDDFPDLYPPTTGETDAVSDEYRAPTTVMSAGSHPHLEQSVAEKMQILRQVPRVRPEENELHLSRVIGIDCDRTTCEAAAKVVDPASSAQGLFAGGPGEARWEDLRVEVYEGAIEVFNDALQEVEAIVLTEVSQDLTIVALSVPRS